MHVLDRRSLDETQEYLDCLIAHTEQDNAALMAQYEQASGATVTSFRTQVRRILLAIDPPTKFKPWITR